MFVDVSSIVATVKKKKKWRAVVSNIHRKNQQSFVGEHLDHYAIYARW